MPVMQATRLAWFGIKPLIGAEVLADRQALLDGTHAADILELLGQRSVLVFPQVHFTDDEQAAFTRTLGEMVSDSAAQILDDCSFWHLDGILGAEPVLASILCAHAVSREGGNTEFASTAAAWEDLPEARKQQIAGLHAVHAIAGARISMEPEPCYEMFSQWQQMPRGDFPLAWTNAAGRTSLLIGNTAVGIAGMDPLGSLDLLVWLRDWATQERFCYSHRWAKGDMVMWDNSATLHRVTPCPPDSGRLMHRTSLAGAGPFA